MTLSIILIFLGIIFFLINLGILSNQTWFHLWGFWPVLLILFGLKLLLDKSSWGNKFLTLLTFFTLGIISLINFIGVKPELISNSGLRNSINQIIDVPKHSILEFKQDDYPNIISLKLDLNLVKGQFNLGENNQPVILSLESDYTAGFGEPEINSETLGQQLIIHVNQNKQFVLGPWRQQPKYELNLGHSEIPTNLEINLGSGNGKVQLFATKLDKADIKVDKGSLDFILAKNSLPTQGINLDIKTGVVDLNLPIEVGFKVTYSVDVGEIEIEKQVFTRTAGKEETYTSTNYDYAKDKVNVFVDVTSGSFTLNRI